MPDVRIKTSRPDYGVNRAAYDALSADLTRLGLSVEVAVPETERRSAGPIDLSPSDVGIFLAQYLAGRVLGQVEGAVRRMVRERRTDRFARHVPIYGPNGDVLCLVTADDEEDDH